MKKQNFKEKEITIDQLAIMVSNGFNGMTDLFNKKLGELRSEIKNDLEDVNLKIDLMDKKVDILSRNMTSKFQFDLLENRVKKLEPGTKSRFPKIL